MLIPAITDWDALIPVGQLIVFFHAGNGLGVTWGSEGDKAEQRNHRFLRSICPSFEDAYIQAYISGSFKPSQFIHPFESYHTTTGRQDPVILSEFFVTVDELAFNWDVGTKLKAEIFLSFVYMYFLVIHPFVDGNGRVSRNLLDYYNTKLDLNMHPSWNDNRSNFSEAAFHKEAFKILYSSELELSEWEYDDVYSYEEVASIQIKRKLELAKMEKKLIESLRMIRSSKTIASKAIRRMAQGMVQHDHVKEG